MFGVVEMSVLDIMLVGSGVDVICVDPGETVVLRGGLVVTVMLGAWVVEISVVDMILVGSGVDVACVEPEDETVVLRGWLVVTVMLGAWVVTVVLMNSVVDSVVTWVLVVKFAVVDVLSVVDEEFFVVSVALVSGEVKSVFSVGSGFVVFWASIMRQFN